MLNVLFTKTWLEMYVSFSIISGVLLLTESELIEESVVTRTKVLSRKKIDEEI